MDTVTKVLTILFGYVTLFYGAKGFRNDPKCGHNYYRTSKIIGGEEVREGEFPWYVSIKETGELKCGGFIIDKKLVLTAAHCFKDFSDRAANSPKTVSVTLAVHYFNRRRLRGEWEQDVKVARIIRHPFYDAFSDSGKYDIAILILKEAINWHDGAMPVCLPELPRKSVPKMFAEDLTEFNSGESAVVAGWATVPDFSDTLHKVSLTLYSKEECMRLLKSKNVTLKTDIDASVICAGSNQTGFDSCSGDSGSALLIQRGRIWVAIGIVSAGFGRCGSAIPALYTRISSYLEWIDLHNIAKIDSSMLLNKFPV